MALITSSVSSSFAETGSFGHLKITGDLDQDQHGTLFGTGSFGKIIANETAIGGPTGIALSAKTSGTSGVQGGTGAGGGNPQEGNFPVIVINNTDSSFGALGNIFIPAINQGNVGDTVTYNDGNQYVIEEMCGCCNVPSGCTDPEALNYDQEAFVDDGSCEYPEEPNDYSGCIPTFCPACQEFENELATNPNATPSNPAIIDTCLSGCCEDPAIQKQYLGGISYGGPYPNIAAYASQSTPNTGGPTPVAPTKSKKPKIKLEEQVIKRLQKLANIKN